MSEDWSQPELVRAVLRIEAAVGLLTKKVDDLSTVFVTRELYEANRKAAVDAFASQQQQIDELKGWQTWAMRLVLGAVVAAVLSTVLYSKGAF